MSTVRVAVDIGGSFTDICILDEATSELRIAKVPFSADPIDAARYRSGALLPNSTRDFRAQMRERCCVPHSQ